MTVFKVRLGEAGGQALILVLLLSMSSFNAQACPSGLSPPQAAVGSQGATLHRPSIAATREKINALPQGIAFVTAATEDLSQLADDYRREFRSAEGYVSVSGPFTILIVGPLLDGPDRVEVARVQCNEGFVTIDLHFTSIRAEGGKLRRNIQWRPLVQVPCRLDPGEYRLQVTWRGLKSLPSGAPLNVPPIVHEIVFQVV